MVSFMYHVSDIYIYSVSHIFTVSQKKDVVSPNTFHQIQSPDNKYIQMSLDFLMGKDFYLFPVSLVFLVQHLSIQVT